MDRPRGDYAQSLHTPLPSWDEDRVLEATMDMIREILGVERCSLLTVDHEEETLRLSCASGSGWHDTETIRVPIGHGPAGKVAETGEPVLVADIRDSEWFDPKRAKNYPRRSFICAPIKRHGQVVAVVSVTNRLSGDPFTQKDMRLIGAVTGFVNMALENRLLLDTTQSLEELLRDLLDSLVVAVVAINRDNRVTCWNNAAERLLGTAPSAALGQDVLDLTPAAVTEKMRTALAAAAKSDISHCLGVEWPHPTPGHADIPLGVTLTQLRRRDGSLDGFVMVFEDLSLFREVVELKRLDEMRSNFIAMVSHELLTPLTSMRGAIHLLDTLTKARLDDTGRQLMKILGGNTERLIGEVNKLLQVTRLQNGSVTLRRLSVDLRELVRECVEKKRETARERRIEIDIEDKGEPAVAWADAEKIKDAVAQLLDNAIKFSRKGENVTIAFDARDSETRVSFLDSGPGVDEEKLANIFDPFTQLEPTMTREKGGVGLGLYIARELARLHGGHIDVAATGPQGSQFVLSLPRTAERASEKS